MESSEIRTAFLKFFEEKGHMIVPSSSLVPHGDPTLLLTTAGMVQMKPYFTGEADPPSRRMTSSQKCFRTTDIDSVGDPGHLTFFEMLGNFSVGDYFKKEAIAWAWELVTERFRLPKERLWITVFLDDDEAERYWLDIGVPRERIVRCGEKDNFWGPAGQTGPCGPCSEIHYDFGENAGCGKADCNPSCGCGRFLEIWNLVFMQFNQDEKKNRTPLPKPNIDTGMGLERITCVMQGKGSVYETDVFAPVIDRISELSGRKYGESEAVTRAMRVVAEHGRAITFLIADGVIPSNDGRGYVLRRVLRRAALFGRKLGLKEAFLTEIGKTVIDQMGGFYPELVKGRDYILNVIEIEESKFEQTLNTGMNLLDEIMAEIKAKGLSVVSGEQAFRLYDTYGFPKEITAEIAAENGLTVDLERFEKEMTAQRKRAREAAKFGLADKSLEHFYRRFGLPPTKFVGYDVLAKRTPVVGLIVNGALMDTASAGGGSIEVILAETPFYGQMGGQLADWGQIRSQNGEFLITDTVRLSDGLIVHEGQLLSGSISVGESVEVSVRADRRRALARSHTATHLLHAALRNVLGKQVRQGGSLVAGDQLRFDFTHLIALSKEELARVQQFVNENIRRDLELSTRVMSYKHAIAEGALAFFEEKYGDEVRVVEIRGERDDGSPDVVSAELCGGTHVRRTGEIGFFHITSEKSVGSGLRRIEALTGEEAEKYAEERIAFLEYVSQQLDSSPGEAAHKLLQLVSASGTAHGQAEALEDAASKLRKIAEKLSNLITDLSAERKRAEVLEAKLLRKNAESLLASVIQVDGVNVISARVAASNMDLMRETGDFLKDKMGSGVIVLGAILDDSPRFLAMVTPDLVSKGVHAGKIIKQVAQVAGGGGGGKPEMAQAGGKDKNKIDEALRLVPKLIGKG